MNEQAVPKGLSEEMARWLAGPLLAAAEHAGLGVTVSLTQEGVVRRIFVSEAAARTLGYPAAELLETSVLLTFAPEEARRMEGLMQKWRDGGVLPHLLETVALRKDGTRVPIEVAYSSVLVDSKPAVIAFIRDITERKRTEGALRASEALFRKLIEAAPDAVLVSRGDRSVYANPHYMRLTGYDNWEELAQKGLDLIHPDDRARADSRRRYVMGSAETPTPREYRILRRDGQTVWVECIALAIDFEGAPALLTFMRDISERRENQAQLIQTDRMATIGTLAAGVAHELNNPLAYILLNLGLFERELGDLVRDPNDMERVKSRLRTLQEGAERMATIVRDLRSFCRPNSKTLRPVDSPAGARVGHQHGHERAQGSRPDRSRLFARSRGGRRRRAPRPGVLESLAQRRTSDVGERPFQSRKRDPHHHPAGRRQNQGGDHRFRSWDPARHHRASLRSFLHDQAGRNRDGARLVDQPNHRHQHARRAHGAKRAWPRGHFAVLLPLPQEVPVSEIQDERPAPVRSDRIVRVLVVDDETALAVALKKVLEPDHEVTAITEGRVALDILLGEGRFDVVLCDVLMPGVSGIDLYRELERERPDIAQRIIFMSGASSMPRVVEFFTAISNERIDKPVDLEHLRALIRQIASIPSST